MHCHTLNTLKHTLFNFLYLCDSFASCVHTNPLFDFVCFVVKKQFSKCSSIWLRQKGRPPSTWGDLLSCRPTITTLLVSRPSWWIHWRPQSVERWQANISTNKSPHYAHNLKNSDNCTWQSSRECLYCFADLSRVPAGCVYAALQRSHETECCSECRLHQTWHCESLGPLFLCFYEP